MGVLSDITLMLLQNGGGVYRDWQQKEDLELVSVFM